MTTDTRAIHVRDAAHEDLEVLVGWNVLLARETEGKELEPSVVRRGVSRVLEEPHRGRYWVAVEVTTGAPVGQCMVTYEWSDWRAADVWYLQSVYVPAAQRRRGVLRALYTHVVACARRDGAFGLRLYVERENEVAQRAYEELGMARSGYHLMEARDLSRGD